MRTAHLENSGAEFGKCGQRNWKILGQNLGNADSAFGKCRQRIWEMDWLNSYRTLVLAGEYHGKTFTRDGKTFTGDGKTFTEPLF